jgi:proteasome lid subunit RPN8/RPN11
MLRISTGVHAEMVSHCWAGLPLEACGLLAGAGDAATACYPTANVAESALVYTVDPKGFLRADRDAEARGLTILGVFHSHTHTAAYPSPTDVAQAPDPDWHYVIVSLADGTPAVRSYRIVAGNITEEPVVLVQ